MNNNSTFIVYIVLQNTFQHRLLQIKNCSCPTFGVRLTAQHNIY
jgi:hypothetical protein